MTVTPARIILVALATARLTRLITRDTLPEHLVIRRVRARARYHEAEVGGQAVRGRPANLAAYVEEWADCPFCSGLWVAGAVVFLEGLTARAPRGLRAVWSGILATLALNYVVGHVSHRID